VVYTIKIVVFGCFGSNGTNPGQPENSKLGDFRALTRPIGKTQAIRISINDTHSSEEKALCGHHVF
jgi:hypothetical protein